MPTNSRERMVKMTTKNTDTTTATTGITAPEPITGRAAQIGEKNAFASRGALRTFRAADHPESPGYLSAPVTIAANTIADVRPGLYPVGDRDGHFFVRVTRNPNGGGYKFRTVYDGKFVNGYVASGCAAAVARKIFGPIMSAKFVAAAGYEFINDKTVDADAVILRPVKNDRPPRRTGRRNATPDASAENSANGDTAANTAPDADADATPDA